MRTLPSWASHLPKPPPPNTITLGVRFQHLNFGETNIQSIAITFYLFCLLISYNSLFSYFSGSFRFIVSILIYHNLSSNDIIWHHYYYSPLWHSVLRTPTTLVSLDSQVQSFNSGSPLDFTWVTLFMPKPENSPKAVSWGKHTVPSLIAQLSGITVHFLMSNVSQIIVSYISSGFVFFKWKSKSGPCYSMFTGKKSSSSFLKDIFTV